MDFLDVARRAPRPLRRPYDAWIVNGRRYAHTAARFWPQLIEDVQATFPACGSMALSAPGSVPLDRVMLYPERALERDLERLDKRDLRCDIRDLTAELNLLGLPAGVHLRIPADEAAAAVHEQALEALDAEIFPNLAAWLPAWAGVDAALWNNEFTHGSFHARATPEERGTVITFDLRNRPLSEGLIERTVSLTWADP